MEIRELVEHVMTDAKISVAKSYNDKGLKASGNFESKLRTEVTEEMFRVKGSLFGPAYGYFLERGRKPNANPSRGAVAFLGKILEKWVVQKGISVNPYAAAYKIVHEGIKVPNRYNDGGVFSDTFNDTWKKNVTDQLANYYKVKVRSDIIENFK